MPETCWNKKIHYTAKSYAYVMDNRVSFDIDQKLDFELAEFFMGRTN
ncbi:hypothetical protein IFVP203_C1100164 [Vibrio parahaemolyticus]